MLTPLDIHKKEFRRVFRGYDEEQVDSFLDQVIMDYEKLYRDNQQLKEQLERAEGSMAQYQEMEEVLKNTLVMAQKNAEELRENTEKEVQIMMEKAQEKAYRTVNRAEQEAREILARAEQQANKMVSEAEKRVRQLLDRYEEIEKQVQVFRIKFKSLLEAELQLLEQEEELFGERVTKTSAEIRESIDGLDEDEDYIYRNGSYGQKESENNKSSPVTGLWRENYAGEMPGENERADISDEAIEDEAAAEVGRTGAPGEADAGEVAGENDDGDNKDTTGTGDDGGVSNGVSMEEKNALYASDLEGETGKGETSR